MRGREDTALGGKIALSEPKHIHKGTKTGSGPQEQNAANVDAQQQMTQLPNPEDEPAETSLGSELLLLMIKLALVVGFIATAFFFIFGVFQMPDESMLPALREGDLVVYYHLQKDYKAGDVVVVEEEGKLACRRVVAVAGDTVDLTADGLVINGYLQSEEHIYTPTEPFKGGATFPVQVGQGQVFVLGDNRPQSKDSRWYGLVDIDTSTKGEVMTVVRRRNF